MTQDEKAQLISVLEHHFGTRDDFYHVVTGPKRETWFTAEAIVALSRAESDSLSTGFIIIGEKSYNTILTELKLQASSSDGLSKIPDIVGYSFGMDSIEFVVEAKLIDELDESGTKTILGDLGTQLARAKTLFPAAAVIGLVFGVHHLSRSVSKQKNPDGSPKHVAVQPQRFFDWLSSQIEQAIPASSSGWIDSRKTIPVSGLQSVEPLGGKWNGQVSLGMAVFEV